MARNSSRSLAFDPIEEARRQWIEHGWVDAADGMAAVTSVMRLAQVFLATVDERLRPFELTFARFEALTLLSFSRNGALPLGKMGQRLQVHPTSVTNAIDRLERQGLVRRVPHPEDRRTVLAEITARGRRVAADAAGVLNDEIFSRLSLGPDQIDEFVALARILRRAAGDFDD